MRKLFLLWYMILIGLLMLLVPKIIFAQTIINVFSENPDHKIYIDDAFAGLGAISGFTVHPGSHYIKVLEGRDVVYSRIVEVEKDTASTVAVDHFVDYTSASRLPNRAAKSQEARRLRRAKGNLAFGLNGSYIPGVSAKLFLSDRIGFQASGWLTNYGDQYYRSLEVRGILGLVDTVILDFPGQLYFAAGQGRRYVPGRASVFTDATFGLEFSLAARPRPGSKQVHHLHGPDDLKKSLMFGAFHLGSSIMGSLLTLDNAYFNIELGVGHIEEPGTPDYLGMTGRVGLHYYF